MSTYPFSEIEAKWQKIWEEQKLYRVDLDDPREKFYCLVMFPYPSGDRLHIGHWYNFGPADTFARYKRMQGYNVFEPIGYDAFGLPAENYAIKVGVHPKISTQKNIEKFRQQLKAIGAMYDFSKEINTSSSEYYRWTQWFFLLLYKHGLAYRKKAPVNWCPNCKTVLANEQVVNGQCERCESLVTKKDLEQWFFKITDYAEKLLEGHDRIDWPEKTITMQKNWIGKSEGAQIKFRVADSDEVIEVFTTRPDTLFGVTYMVLAPEHELVDRLTTGGQREQVDQYVSRSRMASDIDRTSTEREKTGVFIGAYAINPLNQEKVPIWIADYVLLSYGTGCVMAVPAHDERDFEFACKFNLPIREVISPDGTPSAKLESAFIETGIMINSGQFNGLESKRGITEVIDYLRANDLGEARVNYKLRDWLISRQRYWGAPIPIVYCPSCGVVPVPEADLPVLLPDEVEFKGKGESPLLTNPDFVHTTCPQCGQAATREVDTMDTFVCSSWYFLRYPNPRLGDAAFNKEIVNKWLPVDQYIGGAEHAVMHLLYARFFIKVLHDLGMVDFYEPFKRLFHQGTITREGNKMSKSRGNVVSPDKFIDDYGSDTFRMYMMFMGNYADGGDWSDEGIVGISRFLNRVWRMVEIIEENPPTGTETTESEKIERARHYTIKMVSQDLDRFHFNTAISRIMEMVNEIYLYFQNVRPEAQNRDVLLDARSAVLLLLAPFAPHMTEELWHRIGNRESIFAAKWPDYDEEKIKTKSIPIVIQVNGKVRDNIEAEPDSSDDRIIELALATDKIRHYVEGKQIVKTIVVKNKLINIVVRA
ncbi:leucine--tRNA ligase [candidate division KSB1 bacterium]|nr:leucine--tRNA ligase [candidate division KSB1 bacterium]